MGKLKLKIDIIWILDLNWWASGYLDFKLYLDILYTNNRVEKQVSTVFYLQPLWPK